MDRVAMYLGYGVMVCWLGLVAVWLFWAAQGASRAHRRRWEASEPECYMPVLKRREKIAYRTHSPVSITVDSDDPAEAVKVLEKVR